MKETLNAMRLNKAGGGDGVSVEVLRAFGTETWTHMCFAERGRQEAGNGERANAGRPAGARAQVCVTASGSRHAVNEDTNRNAKRGSWENCTGHATHTSNP